MAYRNNIIRKYYTSVINFVTDLWAELSAMGWTLEDNQDGSNYRVYSSGANVNGVKGYMKFSWTTSAFTCIPYTYWNSTSHTGYGAGYAAPYNSLTFSESGTYIWIYGDGTFVALMSLIGTTYDRLIFGHLTPFINVCTYLTAQANSGSNVQITVNSTSGFIAGKKYQIVYSTDNGYRQWVTVNSIDDATHMTIATLSNNYPSGARIGTQPVIFGQTNGTLTNRFGYTCPFGTTGNGGVDTGKDYYVNLT
ncbi:MAG: hypothetical protein GX452_04475, partial [Ignavibacteriales bacterium]|nr:hypothetical protein [Ignavibacteriales bacterium]